MDLSRCIEVENAVQQRNCAECGDPTLVNIQLKPAKAEARQIQLRLLEHPGSLWRRTTIKDRDLSFDKRGKNRWNVEFLLREKRIHLGCIHNRLAGHSDYKRRPAQVG